MERPLDTVIDLQQALTELDAAEAQLHGIPDWMQELHEEHSAKKGEIDELGEAVEAAASERRLAEAETSDAQEKLRTYQEQIGRVRNQREYGALLQEMDGIKATIKECEERALAALERQDAAQGQLEELQAGFQDLDERYSAELEKWEAQKPDVAKEVESLKERIGVLREQISPSSLSLFERVVQRHGGQALAEVKRMERSGRSPQMWSCSACHYRVRPQSVVDITTSGSIVFCDSCKRILYIEQTDV